jgi:hypothetical protein
MIITAPWLQQRLSGRKRCFAAIENKKKSSKKTAKKL